MTTVALSSLGRSWPAYTGGVLLAASGAVLAGALAFEHLGGLAPCVLCLWQRWPHAVVVALALVAVAGLRRRPRPEGAVLMAAGVTLWVGAVLAGYHVGVEQGWWPGPSACGGAGFDVSATAADLRTQLLATPVVRCDAVVWSLFGISMAGYNFLASLVLGALGLYGGARRFIMSR